MISVGSIFLWGFIGTVVLTVMQAAGQALRITRMSIPFLLGTMATADPGRAMIAGFATHFLNGWLFSLVYAFSFEALGEAIWWAGLLLGGLHGLFALLVLIPMLPSIHPRMAGSFRLPPTTAMLEPPGFMARNYGVNTPLLAFAAHLAYGCILGAFYEVNPG